MLLLVSAGITFMGVSTLIGFPNGMDANPGGAHRIGIDNEGIVDVIVEEVLAAARTILSLSLRPAGDITPSVAGISPESEGPIDTDEDHDVTG
ncbi:MAG: hypothetical protein JJT89_10030 [Nitriliruptoraceae bacterium]|nr:hypothetical protein [Nitriliruptoraceae bacterium]